MQECLKLFNLVPEMHRNLTLWRRSALAENAEESLTNNPSPEMSEMMIINYTKCFRIFETAKSRFANLNANYWICADYSASKFHLHAIVTNVVVFKEIREGERNKKVVRLLKPSFFVLNEQNSTANLNFVIRFGLWSYYYILRTLRSIAHKTIMENIKRPRWSWT
jgi:hypothetical protein